MQKKASLSLSIEAIVVLILAISLLGLGLGFTKGMFGQFKSQLVIPEPDIPATADDPIVLPTGGILNIKAAKETIFTVNFFNDRQTAAFWPTIKCGGPNGYDTDLVIGVSINSEGAQGLVVSPQQVEAQTYKSFQMILKANTFGGSYGPPLGYNICSISFCGRHDINDISQCAYTNVMQATKQITINAQ